MGMLISVVYAPLAFMWAGDGMKSRQGEIRYSPLSLSLSELVSLSQFRFCIGPGWVFLVL